MKNSLFILLLSLLLITCTKQQPAATGLYLPKGTLAIVEINEPMLIKELLLHRLWSNRWSIGDQDSLPLPLELIKHKSDWGLEDKNTLIVNGEFNGTYYWAFVYSIKDSSIIKEKLNTRAAPNLYWKVLSNYLILSVSFNIHDIPIQDWIVYQQTPRRWTNTEWGFGYVKGKNKNGTPEIYTVQFFLEDKTVLLNISKTSIDSAPQLRLDSPPGLYVSTSMADVVQWIPKINQHLYQRLLHSLKNDTIVSRAVYSLPIRFYCSGWDTLQQITYTTQVNEEFETRLVPSVQKILYPKAVATVPIDASSQTLLHWLQQQRIIQTQSKKSAVILGAFPSYIVAKDTVFVWYTGEKPLVHSDVTDTTILFSYRPGFLYNEPRSASLGYSISKTDSILNLYVQQFVVAQHPSGIKGSIKFKGDEHPIEQCAQLSQLLLQSRMDTTLRSR
ncbi:MAG: hypothetical protein MUE33_10985 [Cytophagaceae bacterium]|nr:hypothetical protein [Cytophagaceae bacterium]